MRHVALILFTSLFLTVELLAQDKQPDLSAMNQRIAILYQQGKFDDAIPIAEKVVSAEKKVAKNSDAYALALANLAQLYKEKAKSIRSNLGKFEPKNRFGALQASRDSAEKAKKYYREALNVQRSLNNEESVAAASSKTELAWIVYNFLVTDSIRESRAQIDEAEKLYAEALVTEDKLSPASTDIELKTLQDYADFYMKYVNFEKALPLYEKYLTVAETKYGPKSRQSIPALRGLVNIYSFTARDNEARAILDQISGVTGKPENLEVKYLALTARSRGIAKVKADGFNDIDLTDLDRSFSASSARANQIVPPNQYKIKTLEVNILVSESGDVIEAKAAGDSKYDKQVEEAAMASKFRPFVYNGTAQKLRGKVVFSYREF